MGKNEVAKIVISRSVILLSPHLVQEFPITTSHALPVDEYFLEQEETDKPIVSFVDLYDGMLETNSICQGHLALFYRLRYDRDGFIRQILLYRYFRASLASKNFFGVDHIGNKGIQEQVHELTEPKDKIGALNNVSCIRTSIPGCKNYELKTEKASRNNRDNVGGEIVPH